MGQNISTNKRKAVNKDLKYVLSPVEITLYSELLSSVCEEMSTVLQMSALSPNIKERRDFSTAIFDADGGLVAQGTNIPVHLGSMPLAARAAIDAFQFSPGDAIALNDPYCGGTHLPDITLVAPYCQYGERAAKGPTAFLAARAHHADVGGMTSGSLPLSTEIFQEGLIIPPVKIAEKGRLNAAVIEMICANSRTPEERKGDLFAQLASLTRGAERLSRISESLNSRAQSNAGLRWPSIFESLQDYSEAAFLESIRSITPGHYEAKDAVEIPDGKLAKIRLILIVRKTGIIADFSGSDSQTRSPFNAVRAIAVSAVTYVIRCLLPEDVPANSGLSRRVEVLTKPGTIVDALPPSAVSAGNVETSQRIVDVLFQALAKALPVKIPASGPGSMNNVTAGGTNPFSGKPFAYYETIGGGHGGGPDAPGISARHAHMTNSLNTPIEAIEYSYPLRVNKYAVRKNSGGNGRFPGGDGIVREIEFLADSDVSVIGQRCKLSPPGLNGGMHGKPSKYSLKKADKGKREKWKTLPNASSFQVHSGDVLRIETAGGGGFGTAAKGK